MTVGAAEKKKNKKTHRIEHTCPQKRTRPVHPRRHHCKVERRDEQLPHAVTRRRPLLRLVDAIHALPWCRAAAVVAAGRAKARHRKGRRQAAGIATDEPRSRSGLCRTPCARWVARRPSSSATAGEDQSCAPNESGMHIAAVPILSPLQENGTTGQLLIGCLEECQHIIGGTSCFFLPNTEQTWDKSNTDSDWRPTWLGYPV